MCIIRPQSGTSYQKFYAPKITKNLRFYETLDINGLVKERRNSIANALELRLSCTNPWICKLAKYDTNMSQTAYHQVSNISRTIVGN